MCLNEFLNSFLNYIYKIGFGMHKKKAVYLDKKNAKERQHITPKAHRESEGLTQRLPQTAAVQVRRLANMACQVKRVPLQRHCDCFVQYKASWDQQNTP
ncbi:hypothetical protein V5799_006779 [Amblyomma americanum]|uniref:Uncharacterized protein n=1 Tax=Amblyomma americanum TaxID=6943 RepID=A0AAQ4DVF0_AMBAM